MDLARKIEVLDKQVTEAKNGYPDDFERWRTATEVALRTVMGADSPLLSQFDKVRYRPQAYISGMDTSGFRPAGVKKVIAILEAAKSELALRDELQQVVEPEESPEEKAAAAEQGRVFIVHGHDEARKHELFRVVQDVTGIKPIILHEQPSAGRGILEKLETYAASAGFAVALLTGDDVGRAKAAGHDAPRPRQNVVFEAGYFAGRLGRAHVVLLHEAGVELPSDLDGIVYVPLDPAGGWKMKLAHEMANAGLTVNCGARGAVDHVEQELSRRAAVPACHRPVQLHPRLLPHGRRLGPCGRRRQLGRGSPVGGPAGAGYSLPALHERWAMRWRGVRRATRGTNRLLTGRLPYA